MSPTDALTIPRSIAVAYLPGSRCPSTRPPVVVILHDPSEPARRAREERMRRLSESGGVL